MAVPRTNWEALAEQITTKNRLTDTYEIGKTQYNTASTINKASYEDQLAKLRTNFNLQSNPFYSGLAQRGILGSGFGFQNILNRGISQGQAEGTLGKNYLLSQIQQNDLLNAQKRQYQTGLSDADLTRYYKQLAMNESLAAS